MIFTYIIRTDLKVTSYLYGSQISHLVESTLSALISLAYISDIIIYMISAMDLKHYG